MARWDSSKKYRYETIRTVGLAILGFVALVFIVNPWEQKVSYEAEIDKKRLEIRAKIVNEFLANSYKYTSIAYDAFNRKPLEFKQFHGGVYDAYRSTRNNLSVYFHGDLTDEIAHADVLNKELRGYVERQLTRISHKKS